MQSFACDHCKNLVWFENDSCLRCGSILGFSREAHTVLAFVAQQLPGTQNGPLVAWRDGETYSRCATHSWTGCSWVLRDAAPGAFCDACALTRTRPTNDDLPAMTALRDAEAAKRWVIYQLDELGLPVTPRSAKHPMGLAFDLLSSRDTPVTTGHADGLITLDLAEGDDAHREAMREQMAEPYRTVLGHFRHEFGHFYWDVLIADGPDLDQFRELFGDERADYSDALTVHYTQGPPADWEQPMPPPTRGKTGRRPSLTCCISATRSRRPPLSGSGSVDLTCPSRTPPTRHSRSCPLIGRAPPRNSSIRGCP